QTPERRCGGVGGTGEARPASPGVVLAVRLAWMGQPVSCRPVRWPPVWCDWLSWAVCCAREPAFLLGAWRWWPDLPTPSDFLGSPGVDKSRVVEPAGLRHVRVRPAVSWGACAAPPLQTCASCNPASRPAWLGPAPHPC